MTEPERGIEERVKQSARDILQVVVANWPEYNLMTGKERNALFDGIKPIIHQELQKAREEVLPYLKAYKQTLDCDWSINPVQATSLVYRSPESVLRDQADEIERKRTRAGELAKLIDRYQSELDQPNK